jgi:autotransporter-associated beta strand protein
VPNLTDTLTLAGNLSGAGPLIKGGEGLLILSGSNSYGEGTIVSAGRLEVLCGSALPEGTNLTVGAGATLIFDPSLAGAPVVASTVVPVPEPGTLVLLGVGAVGPAGLCLAKAANTRGKPYANPISPLVKHPKNPRQPECQRCRARPILSPTAQRTFDDLSCLSNCPHAVAKDGPQDIIGG